MSYKAIIFDLDGTAIPNKKDGMPSQHLIELVQELKGKVFVCAATGRPFYNCRHILKSLRLTSPCVIFGGTQIIDPVSGKVLWEKLLPGETVEKIVDVAKPFDYKLFISNEVSSSSALEKIVKGPEYIVYIMTVGKTDTDVLLNRLAEIPDVSAHSVPSWTKDHFDIHITHREATKKHALERLLGMLKVNKQEVIGFGDGNNDLPIFEVVGYKVAMGNGSQDLKDLADLIAPSAEEDGLARVLEKLVV
jgi:hypothetical protein